MGELPPSNGNGSSNGNGNGNGRSTARQKVRWDTEPGLAESILTAIENACTITEAAGAAGIARETFYDWMKHRPDISDAITQARKAGRTRRLALIGKHAEKDWRAAAWLLAVENPARYSIKQRVEHSTPERPMGGDIADADTLETLDRLGEALDAKGTESKSSRLPGPSL